MKRLLLSALVVALAWGSSSVSLAQATKAKAPPKAKAPAAQPSAKKPARPAAESDDDAPATAPVAAPATNAANGIKPVAVISIASYAEIMGDISFIGKLIDNPQLADQIEGPIKLFTQNRGLQGLDKTRPWGITVGTEGESFQPLIFLPVEDVQELLTSLAAVVGEPADEGDGLFQIQVSRQSLYVKQVGKWAYLGQSADALNKLPADPLKLLGNLPKQYDFGVRLHVQNIPQMFRDMAIDQLKDGVQNGLQRQPGEDEEQFERRRTLIETQVESLASAINETDTVSVGWSLDQKTKSTYLDMAVTAVPGSKMAKQFAADNDATSKFAGFLVPGAAFNLNASSKIDKQQIEQAMATLDALSANVAKEIDKSGDIPDNQKEVVQQIVGELIDVFKATVKSGQVDVGAALLLDEKSLALVAGAFVADPAKLEKNLRKVVELAKDDPKFPGIKFDADKHAGVRFHTMSIPVEKDDVAKVLGEKLDVAIGIGAKSVYLAVGNDSLALLKDTIDKSASLATKKVSPVQMNLSLSSILKFGAVVNPNDPNIPALLEVLNDSEGRDHVTFVVRHFPGGQSVRIEAQEGVLKILGKVGTQSRRGTAGLE